jgi:redox-sensitive bicupin YhaK (pirin superfamily)
MITIRKASARGYGNFGWLETKHTFSFGHYFDERFASFSDLRVINEDRVQPAEGFPSHSHRDMEILSYVLEGALQHKDSSGGGGVIRYGDVQRLSAGSGVTHSEFNASHDQPVHFLQIWLEPARRGISPGYEQRSFTPADKQGRLRLVASPDGRDGSLTIHQDATVYAARLDRGQETTYRFAEGRKGWVQVARGEVLLSGQALAAGDGAALVGEAALTLAGSDGAELLLFDLRP